MFSAARSPLVVRRLNYFYFLLLLLIVIQGGFHPNRACGQKASSVETSSPLAADLIKRGGVQRGVVSVIGAQDDLAVELATQSELLVHVLEFNAANVNTLREQANQARLNIQRLAVEQSEQTHLPYAENMIDVVIAARMKSDLLEKLSAKEILRALHPGGVAIIGNMHRTEAQTSEEKNNNAEIDLAALRK